MIVATLANYFLTVLIPFKDDEFYFKGKWDRLSVPMDSFRAKYKKYEPDINVMIPKRKLFYALEPSQTQPNEKEWRFLKQEFHVIFSNGRNPVSKKFRITPWQGVCGQAYTHGGQIFCAALTPQLLPTYNFNFTPEQELLTRDLVMVVSCPSEGGKLTIDLRQQGVVESILRK